MKYKTRKTFGNLPWEIGCTKTWCVWVLTDIIARVLCNRNSCGSQCQSSWRMSTGLWMTWAACTWPTTAATTTPHPRHSWVSSPSTQASSLPSTWNFRQKLNASWMVWRNSGPPQPRRVFSHTYFSAAVALWILDQSLHTSLTICSSSHLIVLT